jgi:formylglycine-generating enzyme required for sulfatase activity
VSAGDDPRDCPYVGLDPFDSAHADYFFGRRRESKIIADHVLTRPVTVLYGPSGVGKSSILNVGLPAALKQFADTEREEEAEVGQPEVGTAAAEGIDGDFTIRRLRDWQDPAKAEELLSTWAAETASRPILVILDQFEEYFLYRDRTRMQGLDRALDNVAARRDPPLHLLFGIRDDALHQLDQLRAFIPGILETTIELRGLNDGGVREAILGPIERYNESFRQVTPITVEDALVATLIRQLKEADNAFGRGPVIPGAERRIELPYLQLALTKLWTAEGGAAATAMREVTLIHQLGGVGRIVRDHVNGVMGHLNTREQVLCARMFDRLVNAIGGKIAYPTVALANAEVVGPNVTEGEVEAVLNKLTPKDARILKPVMTGGLPGFEIFHDVLGLPVLEWKRDQEFAAREKEAAVARRARGRTRLVRALLCVLFAGIIAGASAWWNQEWLKDQIYAFRNVHALTAAQEQTLKPNEGFNECTDCPEMVVVPAGSFTMGSPSSEKGRVEDEGPTHIVTIATPFAVSKFEVTFDEWDACVADGGCSLAPPDEGWGRGRRPIINVNWDDAHAYVSWLRKITGKPYRLLTEAEYEYAARGGRQPETAYPWGNDVEVNGTAMANCDGCGSEWNGKQTAPVGSFVANGFGLYDMVGNVWEWVEDCWHENYVGAPTNGSAWIEGGDCSQRFVRGGSWFNAPSFVRSASRNFDSVADRYNMASL